MSAVARRPLRPKEGLVAWATRMLAEGKATTVSVRGVDQKGDQMARNVVHANFAPKCSDPREFGGEATTSPGNRIEVRMTAPCRRCPECLRRKRAVWAFRCVHENRQATFTRFVTLTLTEQARYIILCRAQARAVRVDDDTGEIIPCWDEWSEHQQSYAFFLELGKEVTKYLKRVRKACEKVIRIRYSLFYERGDERRREHVHLLVHMYPLIPCGFEPTGEYYGVPWDDVWWHLTRKWRDYDLVPGVPLGIADADPIRSPEKGGWYVAAYLQQDSHNRARASLRYGPPRLRPLAGKPPLAGSPRPEKEENGSDFPDART